MKQHIFVLFFAVLFAFSAKGQPKLNTRAPRTDFQSILPAGTDTGPGKLDGKFILLEFWATWCTPCVMNIPHLNELQEKFKDRNIVFISVTDEPKEKIEAFMKKRKMNGWVAIDDNGHTFKSYKVSARPATFIIDPEGNVVYMGEPSLVTEDVLNNILSGGSTASIPREPVATGKLGGFGGGEDPVITANFNMQKMGYLLQDVIRPTVRANSGYGWNSHNGSVGISIIGQNITHAVAYINELPTYLRIINRSSVPDTANWDFIFSRSKGYELQKARTELFSLICKTFSIAIKDTEMKTEVLVPSYRSPEKLINKKDIKDSIL